MCKAGFAGDYARGREGGMYWPLEAGRSGLSRKSIASESRRSNALLSAPTRFCRTGSEEARAKDNKLAPGGAPRGLLSVGMPPPAAHLSPQLPCTSRAISHPLTMKAINDMQPKKGDFLVIEKKKKKKQASKPKAPSRGL